MKKILAVICCVLIIGTVISICLPKNSIKISIVGDILLDRGVGKATIEKGLDYPYKKIKETFKSQDMVIGNLEGPITDKGSPILKRSDYIFRADPANAGYLYDAGFTLLDLANNHAMDYGPVGLMDTIDVLKKAGIDTFGAGSDQEASYRTVYINKNNTVIGVMGYTDFPQEGYFHFNDRPDVALLDDLKMKKAIALSKEKCDILIMMFHWGKEFDSVHDSRQSEIAHLACDSGADLVIGSHPHVLQDVEKYNGKYIFYSLGNFVFDRQVQKGTDETVIVQIETEGKIIKNLTLLPIRIIDCQPQILNSNEGEKILEGLKNDGYITLTDLFQPQI